MRELEQANERFELLTRATRDVVWDWDLVSGKLWWSEGFQTVFGYRAEEIEQGIDSWTSRLHPEDLERTVHGIHAVIDAGGTVWSDEYRFRRSDGSWAHILDRGFVMRDAGKAVRMLGAMMDMTERKEAEVALRAKEERFRALVENTSDGIALIGPDGSIGYHSPSVAQIFGFEPGRTVAAFLENLHPEDAVAIQRGLALVLSSPGVAVPTRARVRLADGSFRVIAGHFRNLLDNDAVRGIVCNFRDVTEREQMEARLMMADRLASVGTLAAGVAHEINNPLAYLITNLGFVADSLSAATQESPNQALVRDMDEALREALEGSHRVRNIVRDLKTFSRAEETQVAPVDLHRVLDVSVNMAWNEIRHRARLVKDYAPATFLVNGNESRLGQVFLNLLVNAAQAIGDGDAEHHRIQVSTREHKGQCVVEVSDTGQGIEPRHRSRLFDPFFTTKSNGVGTGLGLFICQSIVTAAGGTLAVSSELGRGTSFVVTLPSAGAQAALPPSAVAASAVDAPRLSVLVIDDEAMIGQALRRSLREHDITFSQSARGALDRIANGQSFDVILCDVMMPEMSGLDFYRSLQERAPGLLDRVVFATGGAFTPTATEFLQQVPNPRLEKPFTLELLRQVIRRVGRQSAQTA